MATTFIKASGRHLWENNLCCKGMKETSTIATVAVKKEKKIVGHVPKELSKKCSDFLKSGGVIGCEVTGKRRKGKGLEVPCKYTFCGT